MFYKKLELTPPNNPDYETHWRILTHNLSQGITNKKRDTSTLQTCAYKLFNTMHKMLEIAEDSKRYSLPLKNLTLQTRLDKNAPQHPTHTNKAGIHLHPEIFLSLHHRLTELTERAKKYGEIIYAYPVTNAPIQKEKPFIEFEQIKNLIEEITDVWTLLDADTQTKYTFFPILSPIHTYRLSNPTQAGGTNYREDYYSTQKWVNDTRNYYNNKTPIEPPQILSLPYLHPITPIKGNTPTEKRDRTNTPPTPTFKNPELNTLYTTLTQTLTNIHTITTPPNEITLTVEENYYIQNLTTEHLPEILNHHHKLKKINPTELPNYEKELIHTLTQTHTHINNIINTHKTNTTQQAYTHLKITNQLINTT